MSKKGLRVEFVASAREWANLLVRRESRGPGDTENAMRRLATRHGIPWRMFWNLRYRPPPDIFISVFYQLKAAYESECKRQLRLLKHELEITKAIAGPDAASVRAAQTVVDAAGEKE